MGLGHGMADKLGGLIVLGFLLLAVVLYLRRGQGADSPVTKDREPQSKLQALPSSFPAAERLSERLVQTVSRPGSATHRLEYADAFGEVTERSIQVQRVYEGASGIIYVEAFCELRMEQRTFRSERILKLSELPSGRPFPDPRGYFDKWPGKRPLVQRSPQNSQSRIEEVRALLPPGHKNIMDRARPGLRIMIWLAKADRSLSEPEEQVMLAWIHYRSQGVKAAGHEWSRDAALSWLRSERVTFTEVERGAARLGQAEGARLVEMLEDLMLADGEKCRLEIGRAKKIMALLPER